MMRRRNDSGGRDGIWARSPRRHGGLAAGVAVLLVGLLPGPARAQMGGSLGGYGAASPYGSPAMGGGGGSSLVIPYGGMDQGLMPGRIGDRSLSLRARPGAGMGAVRPSLNLAPMGAAATSKMRGRPVRLPTTPGSFAPIGSIGMGGGMGTRQLPAAPGVMPPNFGSPFRAPTLPIGGSTGGAMTMGPGS